MRMESAGLSSRTEAFVRCFFSVVSETVPETLAPTGDCCANADKANKRKKANGKVSLGIRITWLAG